jgi:S-DNA-T family DNA segregation ATPase FtsK/SpoIIIE
VSVPRSPETGHARESELRSTVEGENQEPVYRPIDMPVLTYQPEYKPVEVVPVQPEFVYGQKIEPFYSEETESPDQSHFAYTYGSDYNMPRPPQGVEPNRLRFADKPARILDAVKIKEAERNAPEEPMIPEIVTAPPADRSEAVIPHTEPDTETVIIAHEESGYICFAGDPESEAEQNAYIERNDAPAAHADAFPVNTYVPEEEIPSPADEDVIEDDTAPFEESCVEEAAEEDVYEDDLSAENSDTGETVVEEEPETTAAVPAAGAHIVQRKTLIQEETEEPEEVKAESSKIFDEIPINEDYIIPANFLVTSKRADRESWESEIRRNSELLVKTLADFSIESRVSCVNRGPVVTLYEMTLAPGIKVTRIVSLADDIAMALAAARVRVVAPIPGKSAIGIEVPNVIREMVTLGDIIASQEYKSADMMLKIAMGKDILGKPCMIDLKKQPHLLIAGATGAGKSVCVNGVITSLVYNYDPNHVRFILIDPKMVELQLYNGLPHLLTPVITDPDECPKALKWAILEMERRYRLLSEQCVRDIDRYNQKIDSLKHPEEFERLPYIVIIIDEFADLMMVAPKEVENYVTRIAQKARAIGIHLVLATQRPSVDIITGIIKANFPARVAFQVAQKTDSRTIIDQNGAEKLLGKGDMLYQSPTSAYPVRMQGAFIAEEEIMQIVQKACKYARPRYIDFEELLKQDKDTSDESGDFEDEMFELAMKIIEETKKASASYLQRRLSIGYNRAARMIERMEERGYIGPQVGSKAREVYI